MMQTELDQAKIDIVKDRLMNASECYAAALDTFRLTYYKTSAGRLYYAVFNLMRALLEAEGIEMRHHSGVISEFRKRYVKTGVFSSDVSVLISELFDIRSKCDYSAFYELYAENVEPFFSKTEQFMSDVKQLLLQKYSNFTI